MSVVILVFNVYPFFGQLSKITQYFIPEVPVVLVFFNTDLNGTGGIGRDVLVHRGDHIVVEEGLEGLVVCSLEYHFDLFL